MSSALSHGVVSVGSAPGATLHGKPRPKVEQAGPPVLPGPPVERFVLGWRYAIFDGGEQQAHRLLGDVLDVLEREAAAGCESADPLQSRGEHHGSESNRPPSSGSNVAAPTEANRAAERDVAESDRSRAPGRANMSSISVPFATEKRVNG